MADMIAAPTSSSACSATPVQFVDPGDTTEAEEVDPLARHMVPQFSPHAMRAPHVPGSPISPMKSPLSQQHRPHVESSDNGRRSANAAHVFGQENLTFAQGALSFGGTQRRGSSGLGLDDGMVLPSRRMSAGATLQLEWDRRYPQQEDKETRRHRGDKENHAQQRTTTRDKGTNSRRPVSMMGATAVRSATAKEREHERERERRREDEVRTSQQTSRTALDGWTSFSLRVPVHAETGDESFAGRQPRTFAAPTSHGMVATVEYDDYVSDNDDTTGRYTSIDEQRLNRSIPNILVSPSYAEFPCPQTPTRNRDADLAKDVDLDLTTRYQETSTHSRDNNGMLSS